MNVTGIIYKYTLPSVFGEHKLSMCKWERILSVQNQNGIITLWVSAYSENKYEKSFYISPTGGHSIGGYIGTVQIEDLVYHIFENN